MGWWTDLKTRAWHAGNWLENNVGQSPAEIGATVRRSADWLENNVGQSTEEIQTFWHDNDGSLVRGTGVAFEEARDALRVATNDTAPWVTTSTAIVLNGLQFAVSLPLGLTDWAVAITERIPDGPGPTIYTALERPLSGIWNGANHVWERVDAWTEGDLLDRPLFDQVDNVAETAFVALGVLWGIKSTSRVLKPPANPTPGLVPVEVIAGDAAAARPAPPVPRLGPPGVGSAAPLMMESDKDVLCRRLTPQETSTLRVGVAKTWKELQSAIRDLPAAERTHIEGLLRRYETEVAPEASSLDPVRNLFASVKDPVLREALIMGVERLHPPDRMTVAFPPETIAQMLATQSKPGTVPAGLPTLSESPPPLKTPSPKGLHRVPLHQRRATPPPRRLVEEPDPGPAESEMTQALKGRGLDPKAVAEWAAKKRTGRNRTITAAVGVTAAAAAAAAAGTAYLVIRRPDATPILTLEESNPPALDTRIDELDAALRDIGRGDGNMPLQAHVAEIRGEQWKEARVYALFHRFRENTLSVQAETTLADIERVLNTASVTDLRMRRTFYLLIKGYVTRVELVRKNIAEVLGRFQLGRIEDQAVAAQYVSQHYGFVPNGRVTLNVRDVHVACVFDALEDYIRASSPNDPLWKKTPAQYDPEERVRVEAIERHALRTGGMSFGNGNTIARRDDPAILAHEEGHEMDALGPYFAEYRLPWHLLARPPASDPPAELATLDRFLEAVFTQNGRRSLHTEMIQYLRESGRLAEANPFALGGLYDPREQHGLDAYIATRYADRPELLTEAQAHLAAAHRTFFAEVDGLYDVLAALDRVFQQDPTQARELKPLVLGYLATRGSEPWTIEELRAFLPAH